MRTLVISGCIGPAFDINNDPRYVDIETVDIHENTYRVHSRNPGLIPTDTRSDAVNGAFRTLAIVASDPHTALALAAH